jgi:hypothetical protein
LAVPADPAPPADPVLLADPVLSAAAELPADPVLSAAPVLPADPVLPDLVSVAPVLPAAGLLSAGLPPPSPEDAGLDVGEAGVEELALADVDPFAWGPADFGDWVELAGQGLPVALAVCWAPVALPLAFADAVELAPPVAVEVELAGSVAVALAVAVAVAVAVPVAAGLLLVLPVGGLLAGVAVGALGVAELADLADLAWVDDCEPVRQPVGGTAFCPADVTPWLPPPPADVLPGVADPFRLGVPAAVLELEIPTAEASWPTAWRSGGTARATPMANTTQAAARAGRSSPNPQSRCRCRAPVASCPSAPAASCPPSAAFQRRTMTARKPPLAAECLLAWADPELTRARIRSRPSWRGSS